MSIERAGTLMERLNGGIKGAMSITETAEFIGHSRSTVWQLIRSGRLPARKSGRRTIILTADALRFLDNLPRRDLLSEPHRKRALERWAIRREELDR
ncbi:MAG: helix-turn-helix domain-containing protein [Terriglobales bacterium]